MSIPPVHPRHREHLLEWPSDYPRPILRSATFALPGIATFACGLMLASPAISAPRAGGSLPPPASSTPTTTASTILEGRTIASSDDAEEFADSVKTMYLKSSDLELTHDTYDQTVGMRWTGLTIPSGSTITAAYIQFASKESNSQTTNLTISGQAADNATTFTSTSGDISSRPRTAGRIGWAPAPWVVGEVGPNQQTPDLSAVIQEIVNRPGWASGNALVLIITGTGHRTAWAYDGSPTQSPLLHVEYASSSIDNPPTARLSVTQASSPALTVTADASASTDPDATPIASYQFDFGDGSPPVTTTAPTATAQHTYAAAGTYTVTLTATDTGGLTSAPAAASLMVAGITALERRTTTSSDDAEEYADGTMHLTSPDLELVYDGINQTVGMRWTNLTIPPGASITTAYIQFSAKESQSEATSLTIRGQAADKATTFTTTAGDISTRPRTTAAATWAPVPWTAGETGPNQRTPDLSAPVQEIVSRSGWASGNALVLIVTGTGTGHRTAWANDGNAAASPLLHVEYTLQDIAPIARLALALAASPPLTVTADASASTDPDATPIATYRFDFGDGSPAVTTHAPTSSAQHTYAAPGI